ncbi:accessory gene regulator AgrB [Enterococcus sp. CWB-B31]|uniref:accessory gene regulator AgrB n=1 Tax=Enterococcus sp. CWB-B31 TaxID=2885159 RepID=UPI001E574D0F|nr:accessory gene regulator AgrB [Enterococcus sp. CWB-B31]MCB5954888.1 accessory gene regulator AgrB [Enterococcus sp. CWB-B31]
MEKTIWNLWNVENYLSNKILAFILEGQNEIDRISYLKCKLGVESIVVNLSKLLFIYTTALILNVGFETLILHLSFLTVRVFAYGEHAGSSFGCIISSILLFVGFAGLLVGGLLIPESGLLLLQLINLLILSKYAPGVTSKNPVGSEEKRRRRRIQAMCSCILVTAFALCVPVLLIQNLLIVGNFLSSVTVLPVLSKKMTEENEK